MILIILKNCLKVAAKFKFHQYSKRQIKKQHFKKTKKQQFKKIKKQHYKTIIKYKIVYNSKRKEKQVKILTNSFKNINNLTNSLTKMKNNIKKLNSMNNK